MSFLIIKPTGCISFSNLFLKWNSKCSGQFLCPSSGGFQCTHCEQDQDGSSVPFWSCSQAVSKSVWHIPLLCVQWKIPDDGQRNGPKHLEFHSKNKFEKMVHLVGFIIRNLTRCTVTWTSKEFNVTLTLILLTCRIGWGPNNTSRWQMGFNLAFKGLSTVRCRLYSIQLR